MVTVPALRRAWTAVGTVLLLLSLIAAAAWLVPPWLDWSRSRGTIARFAAAQLGRPVRIDGAITVSLLPRPLVTARAVSLGPRGDGMTITAPFLRLRLALAPLLLGHVVPRALVLSGAAIVLPWPLPPAALAADRPGWLGGSSARIEHGSVRVGAVMLTGVDAELSSVAADPGAVRVTGGAVLLGQRWRFTAGVGTRDGAGDTPVDAAAQAVSAERDKRTSVVGQAEAHLVGMVRHDGALTGRLTAQADDLSRVLAAPPVAAKAEGTVALGGGKQAADLTLTIGGAALTARLLPDPGGRGVGQTLFVTAGELDGDAWQAAWARRRPSSAHADAASGQWPLIIDFQADAIRIHGGLVRAVHVRWDGRGRQGMLRAGSAIFPGDAALTLVGSLDDAALPAAPQPSFSGHGTLDAPQLRTTLEWLRQSGLKLGTRLPADVLREAKLAFDVTADPGRLQLAGMDGTVEQSRLTGRLGVDTASGMVKADLTLDKLGADNWLPPDAPLTWAALHQGLDGVALTLKLHVGEVLWRGRELDQLVLSAAANAGGFAIDDARFDIPSRLGMTGASGAPLHVRLSGTIAGDGAVSEGRLDVSAPQGTGLARLLPDWVHRTDYLWAGAVTVHAEAAGPQTGLIAALSLDLIDARLEAHPTIDLTQGTWRARMTLRHPGAPRLLDALGLAHARDWLGEGSLSLLAQLSGSPGHVKLDSFDLTAGTLHATGGLSADRLGSDAPVLTGQIAADTLPLPVIDLRDAEPWRLAWLAGWEARIGLSSAVVTLADKAVLHGAAAALTLHQGVLTLDGLQATAGGGKLSGHATLNSATLPPRIALELAGSGIVVATPLFGTGVDLDGGTLSGSVSLRAQGFSTRAWLATLAGTVHVAATSGSLGGFDLAALHQLVQAPGRGAANAAVVAAANGGSSRFDRLSLDATAADGVVTVDRLTWSGPDGMVQAQGEADLPSRAMHLVVHGPDGLDVRLEGPVMAPKGTVSGGQFAAGQAP